MNKIVREHYPVENLPEDLQALVGKVGTVTIEITEENTQPRGLTRDELAAMLRESQRDHAARGTSVAPGEAVRRIRELRDEWDD